MLPAIDFARSHWKLIAAGLLVLALAYQTLTKRAVVAERDQLAREAVIWKEAHETQEQSILDLVAALNRKNAETDERAAALAKARGEAARLAAEMDARAATTRDRITRLNDMARNENSVCGVSDRLMEALDGL